MGGSLAQIIAERKAYLRESQSLMRKVDTEVERIERKIKSLLSRKIKVPEMKDFEKLAEYGVEFDNAVSAYYKHQDEVLEALKYV